MNSLKEKKILVRMKQRLGEEVPQSLLDEIAEEEAAIVAEQEKQSALQEERKNAFKGMFSDLSSQLSQLMAEEKKKTAEEQAILDRFSSVLSRVDEIKAQIAESKEQTTEEFIEEIIPQTVEMIPEEIVETTSIILAPEEPAVQPPIKDPIKDVADKIKVSKPPSAFVQPDPPPVSRDIKDIQSKLKMLEGWVSKISMTGPGGGAVWLRDLDDVARSSVLAATDGQILTYNESIKKWTAQDPASGGSGGYTLPTASTTVKGGVKIDGTTITINNQVISANIPSQVQSDWSQANTSAVSYINNKPTLFSGSYTDLTDKPTIPAAQIQSDWNQSNNVVLDYIKNKPTVPAYIDDLSDVTTNAPTPGQVLKYNGSQWVNDTDLTAGGGDTTPGYYGSFFDDATQTVAHVNTPTPVYLRSAPIGVNGVTIVNNTRITTTYTGVYNFQFSFQLHNKGGGGNGQTVFIWMRKNGVDVPDSTTDVAVNTNSPAVVAAWNFVLPSNAGDYWEFMWATDNNNIVIDYINPTSTWPGTPSAIVTVSQVAAVLIPTDITGTANNANYLDGYHANTFQTVAGLSSNVATLTSNNTSFVGSISAANVVSNSQLSSNLANYQTTAGLSANVATLTSNNTSYVGSISAANVVSNTQLQSNLANYQTTAGLSANVAVLSSNNSLYLGGTAASGYAKLNANATFANVTANVITATTITTNTITANAATAFIAGDAAASGVALQMPNEGALRNMTNGFNTMYFDVSNGGATHGGFRFRSSNGFTELLDISTDGLRAITAYKGKTPFNSALDTVVTVDNLKFRISNQGGVFPQVASASGSVADVCYDIEGVVSGLGVVYANNQGYILLANGTWLSVYSSHGMDSRGDRLTMHITDKAAGRIYRATYMKTNNSSNADGYNIVVERIL